jgi:hypothetical protein
MTTVRETFGLACPKCRDDEHILVAATEFVRLVPDGTISAGDQEWALDSTACCTKCNHSGIVAEFEAKDDQPPLARPSSRPTAPVPNDVCCELAHALTVRECAIRGITVDAQATSDDDENRYTEEAQDIFMALYDLVCGVLEPYCEEVAP